MQDLSLLGKNLRCNMFLLMRTCSPIHHIWSLCKQFLLSLFCIKTCFFLSNKSLQLTLKDRSNNISLPNTTCAGKAFNVACAVNRIVYAYAYRILINSSFGSNILFSISCRQIMLFKVWCTCSTKFACGFFDRCGYAHEIIWFDYLLEFFS